jgi:type VI secretion system FHA domain protein
MAAEAQFTEAGGTIGRSANCTLALPDPERHISRVQAEITCAGGQYLLVDRGTANPVQCNGIVVGTGRSVSLADGDELHIGDYVLRVEVSQMVTATVPFDPFGGLIKAQKEQPAASHGHPMASTHDVGDHAFPESDASAAASPLRPSDQGEKTSADETHTDDTRTLFRPPETHPTSTMVFRSWDRPEGVSRTVTVGRSVSRAAGLPPGPLDASGPDALLQALLSGAGLRERPDDPNFCRIDEETMRRLGSLLRLFAQGAVDLLAIRASFKQEMHARVTVIAARGNNPLKFSPDADAALRYLLADHSTRGFMEPEEAIKDAMTDLLAHQAGLASATRAAVHGLLQRLDPAALEMRLAGRPVLDSMLRRNRKAKLWELFEEVFAEVSREAEDDFEALFGRVFVKAYEAQEWPQDGPRDNRLESRDRKST